MGAQKRRQRSKLILVAQQGKDRPRCTYCGTAMSRRQREDAHPFTMDHIIPRAHGGLRLEENLLPACQPCNLARGSTPLPEFIASLGERAAITVEEAQRLVRRAEDAHTWKTRRVRR